MIDRKETIKKKDTLSRINLRQNDEQISEIEGLYNKIGTSFDEESNSTNRLV